MHLLARAKINWSLDITGIKDTGYHTMDMLMQPVTLHDDIYIEPSENLSLTCDGTPYIEPDEHHLALRAARLLIHETGKTHGARLHVTKRIPAGAGMGGGSADAAAVLLGLNRQWNLELSDKDLDRIGLMLGADIPFCLHGGFQRVTGIGECLESLGTAPEVPLCVIQPCSPLSTKEIFQSWNSYKNTNRQNAIESIKALQNKDLPAASRYLYNVLQPISEIKRPAIREAVQALRDHGALFAAMTGSGSAVFGAFDSSENAESASESLKQRWISTYTCSTCSESVVFLDK